MKLVDIRLIEGDVIPFRPRKKQPMKCPKCGETMRGGTDVQTQQRVKMCLNCFTTIDETIYTLETFRCINLKEAAEFAGLKKRKITLTPEEREEAIKAGAVWHPSNHDKPTCAIWKSKRTNGKTVYGCNTHRVYQTAPTLKGAIEKFHSVVKGTS